MNKEKLDLLYVGMPDKPDATEGEVFHYSAGGVYVRSIFVPKDSVIRMHVHDYDHLSIVAHGKGRFMREGGTVLVCAGDILEIKAGERHCFLALEDTNWMCVHNEDAAEAKELYGWKGRLANKLRVWFQRRVSANFVGILGAVGTGLGIISSVSSMFGDDSGEQRAEAGAQQGAINFAAARKDRELADRQRAAAGEAWAGSGSTLARGSQYYDALADLGKEQLTLWRSEGIPLLKELGLKMADTTDRTAEETGIAAENVKNQYALGRENTKRSLEFARNPGDPGYGDIMQETYGREAADVAAAMTNARRAERARLEGVDQQNWQRKQALANIYGQQSQLGASNVANAGLGQTRTGAIQQGAATAQETLGAGSDVRASTLEQGGFSAIDRGLAAQGESNAQLGYGGAQLASNASRWASKLDPKTGETVSAPTYGGPGNVDPDMMGAYNQNASYGLPYAEGGEVKGPGTGTSDSVGAIKRPGTYILSADTVRALGHKKLEDLMEKAGVRKSFGAGGEESDKSGVGVRLSSGEWAMPPEVTKYHGEEFFNKLQQKFHRPVFSEDAAMANGGPVRKRALPSAVEDAIFAGMKTHAISRRG